MNYKIKDLCEVTSSRRIFAKEYKTSGIPFFRSQEIIELAKKGNTTPTIYISNDRYNEIISSGLNVPSKGDILMSAIGANRGHPWNVSFDGFYFKDGNVIWFRNFSNKCNSKYLTYSLSTDKYINMLQTSSEHSAQGAITLDLIKNIEIHLPPLDIQQHIVNTIGSVDDLIENNNKKIEKLMNLGLIKINLLNNKKDKIDLSTIAKFEKGNELGSSNYFDYYKENFINYIRVGDLLSKSNTYVDKSICNKFIKQEDILIAMDGAPGRNAIGLNGSYSSGLYKIICNTDKKGLVYFELNSDLNQNIIKDMSQGTTILHASKSIPFLKTIDLNEEDNKLFNNIFNEIVILKKKVSLLKKIKDKLLIKYFTNQ